MRTGTAVVIVIILGYALAGCSKCDVPDFSKWRLPASCQELAPSPN